MFFGQPPIAIYDDMERRLPYLQPWLKELDRFVRDAAGRQMEVVLVLPAPHFKLMHVSHTTEHYNSGWFAPTRPADCELKVKREDFKQGIAQLERSLRTLADQHANLYLFDPVDVFCPPERPTCGMTMNDEVIYRDYHHLNNRGGELLYTRFVEFLRSNNLLGASPSPLKSTKLAGKV